MSVSVEGGKGGKRKLNAELNLVPFIDLLSVQITFLLATAVWIEISSLPVDQAVNDPNSPPPPPMEVPPPPPLTVHVRADGVWIGRKVEEGKNFSLLGEAYDWGSVEKEVIADRREYPDEVAVVISTDDGVHYGNMIKALDITRVHGYDKSLLAGGPAQQSNTQGRR